MDKTANLYDIRIELSVEGHSDVDLLDKVVHFLEDTPEIRNLRSIEILDKISPSERTDF